jgi:hypothetical protein
MLNPVKEFGQIHVHAVTVAGPDMGLHLPGCSVSGSLRSEAETRLREVGIEDRRQDLQDGLLDQSVLDIGNAQVAFRAIGFGDGFPAGRGRLVGSLQQLLSDARPLVGEDGSEFHGVVSDFRMVT